MRIISGIHRGRKITAPAKLPVRPTTDFAKTGLFNILNSRYRFQNIHILDLFCGIGSFTFEFQSRGSTEITAIDNHPGCISFIREMLEQLNAPSTVKPILSEVMNYLEKCNTAYDVILADPPFAVTPADLLVNKIFEKKLLKPKGVFILEHSSKNSFDTLPHFVEKLKYGNVTFSFFQNTLVDLTTEEISANS